MAQLGVPDAQRNFRACPQVHQTGKPMIECLGAVNRIDGQFVDSLLMIVSL